MDEDLQINSEIIWTFTNVENELVTAYPNGQALSENLITIDNLYTWKVDFYPNGKNEDSMNHVYIGLTLVNVKEGVDPTVNAECNYYMINKTEQRKNFTGQIERRNFTSFLEESDAGFGSEVLDKDAKDLMISISITQYPVVEEVQTEHVQAAAKAKTEEIQVEEEAQIEEVHSEEMQAEEDDIQAKVESNAEQEQTMSTEEKSESAQKTNPVRAKEQPEEFEEDFKKVSVDQLYSKAPIENEA